VACIFDCVAWGTSGPVAIEDGNFAVSPNYAFPAFMVEEDYVVRFSRFILMVTSEQGSPKVLMIPAV